jgi:hypothetical protein
VKWFLGVLTTAVWGAMLWKGLALRLSLLDHCRSWACDFQLYYLPQVRTLFEGSVHPDWNYPPLLAILLQGLGFLEDFWATLLWTGFNLGLVGILSRLCYKAAGWSGFFTVYLSLPVLHALKWGQLSLVVVVLVLVGLGKKMEGICIGLAAALKVYPLLLFFGPLQRRGQGLGVVLGSLLFSVAVLGWTHFEAFGQAILKHQLINQQEALKSAAALGGQGLGVAFYRFFISGQGINHPDARPLLFSLPEAVVWLGPMLGLGSGFFLCWRSRHPHRLLHLLSGLTLAMQPSWHHFFCFLPLIQAHCLAGKSRILGLTSVLIGAIPLLFLPFDSRVYYPFSLWSGTTLAVLVAWLGLALQDLDPVSLRPRLDDPAP